MIRLSKRNQCLILDSAAGDMAPRHVNQLAFWGFVSDGHGNRFTAYPADRALLASKVSKYFSKYNLQYELGKSLANIMEERQQAEKTILESKINGSRLKDGIVDEELANEFFAFLDNDIHRTLRDHQVKSALHLLAVGNGANFSVPGSGKTTVVLAVFEMLRKKGMIDSLFVVGPPSCFGPWRDEYEEVLGKPPRHVVLAGGIIDRRLDHYLANTQSACDLYLTSFQTLLHDVEHVKTLFRVHGIRFYLVVDEAHYIKQVNGAWANATLQISRFAERRCVLTGTPFPKSYADAFNIFDLLWPISSPISKTDKHRISMFAERREYEQASEVLNEAVGPLFYRVRKNELGLAEQVFNSPIIVRMNEKERTVYDAIVKKIDSVSQRDYLADLELTLRLQRGRMMRLRQSVSYTKLLATALDGYNEELIEDNRSVASLIANYDEIETPAKILTLVELVRGLRAHGEKLVIWSNFIKTLELIQRHIKDSGLSSHLIYGATPLERATSQDDDLTRERIIREFVSNKSGIDILIANPAACAESISLHKSCSHAIYYDLSYNCAQYLQSLDRIHRVGGSENKSSHYYFLQYERSVDHDIWQNVKGKAERMSKIIDQEYPIYSLDMFDPDEEHSAYRRLFSGGWQGLR